MSGGINGAILQQVGPAMQENLHRFFLSHTRKYVDPGFAIRLEGPHPFAFATMVYTVGVDAWYRSTVAIVRCGLVRALGLLAEDRCRTVAIPALATGYGNLSGEDFGRALGETLAAGLPAGFTLFRVILNSTQQLERVRKGFAQSGRE